MQFSKQRKENQSCQSGPQEFELGLGYTARPCVRHTPNKRTGGTFTGMEDLYRQKQTGNQPMAQSACRVTHNRDTTEKRG